MACLTTDVKEQFSLLRGIPLKSVRQQGQKSRELRVNVQKGSVGRA